MHNDTLHMCSKGNRSNERNGEGSGKIRFHDQKKGNSTSLIIKLIILVS